jgi:hypothetical protein
MAGVADEEREPELISLRAAARRLVAEGLVEHISHQRLSKIAGSDPAFPALIRVGSTAAVDWHALGDYWRDRITQPGRRTDLEVKDGPS